MDCEHARPYTVEYDPKALKEIARLDKPVARRILKAVDALRAEPRPHGARPLVGYPDLWRVRVGDYRMIYAIKPPSSWSSRCASHTPAPSTAACNRGPSTWIGASVRPAVDRLSVRTGPVDR